jgi:hypothetical protein
MQDYKKGQIAFLYVKDRLLKSSLKSLKKRSPKLSRKIGVSKKDFDIFIEEIFLSDTEMKEYRQGEIAVAFIKKIIYEKGFRFNSSVKKEVLRVSEKTNVSPEEARDFFMSILNEALYDYLS